MFEENMYNNQPSVRITSFSLALINTRIVIQLMVSLQSDYLVVKLHMH